MVQVKFTIDFDQLTEAMIQRDMQTMMKSLTLTVFFAYIEIEPDFTLLIGQCRTKLTDHQM